MGSIVSVTFCLGALYWQLSHPSAESGSAEVVPTATPAPRATDVSTRCHAEAVATLATAGLGAIDAVARTDTAAPISDLTTLAARTPLTFIGWAAPGPPPRTGAAVCLAVDGSIATSAKILYGVTRPDVAAAYGNAALQNSGFSIQVPSGTLGRGKHAFKIVVIDLDGNRSTLKAARTLSFR